MHVINENVPFGDVSRVSKVPPVFVDSLHKKLPALKPGQRGYSYSKHAIESGYFQKGAEAILHRRASLWLREKEGRIGCG